jgi:hypothetical protein
METERDPLGKLDGTDRRVRDASGVEHHEVRRPSIGIVYYDQQVAIIL